MFNCHKYELFGVGKAVIMDDFDNYDPKGRLLTDTVLQTIIDNDAHQKKVKFFQHLLKDDERKSLMDLEYHIDYVQQFGVKEMIPLSDELNFVTYRNWDVYLLTFTVLGLLLKIVLMVLSCLCGLCSKR